MFYDPQYALLRRYLNLALTAASAILLCSGAIFSQDASGRVIAAVSSRATAAFEADKKLCRSSFDEPADRLKACANVVRRSTGGAKAAAAMKSAKIREALDDYVGASRDADIAALAVPNNLSAENARCWYRAVANMELETARLACAKALEVSGGASEVRDSAGLVDLRMKNWEGARQHYESAAQSDGKVSAYIYGRGLALLALGRSREAAKDLQNGREAKSVFAKLGLSPVSVTLAATSEAGARASGLTQPVRLSSNVATLSVTVDGRLVAVWTLADASPDILNIASEVGLRRVVVCLQTTRSKACHTLSKGRTGIYLVRYKGEDYLAHFEA